MDKTKLQQQTADLIGSYDERRRTFDALRDQTMDDTKRQAAIDAYKKANAEFERQKAATLK